MTEGLFDEHIPLLRPWLGEEEISAVTEVIRSGWISLGPKVAEFEAAVAQFVGCGHAVATNSATSALHLALRLSGINPGDRVICPSFTCMATANAIHGTGAEPLFVDIDSRTFNLDPVAVTEALTSEVTALMVVDQIGLPADMDSLRAIALRNGLKLIEDAATSFGARYRGRRLGSLGPPTAFSFHPRKMITTGEGGMLCTDDSFLAEKARELRSAGASISDLVRHRAKGVLVQKYYDYGYNYRMTDMQAAIGIVQLAKVEAMIEQRRSQAGRYGELLSDIDEIELPLEPDFAQHAWTSYLVRLKSSAPLDRDTLLKEMADEGISCRVGIQPLHWEPFYRERYGTVRLPVTEEAAKETIFLPIFPGLTDAQIELIVSAVRGILARARRRCRS